MAAEAGRDVPGRAAEVGRDAPGMAAEAGRDAPGMAAEAEEAPGRVAGAIRLCKDMQKLGIGGQQLSKNAPIRTFEDKKSAFPMPRGTPFRPSPARLPLASCPYSRPSPVLFPPVSLALPARLPRSSLSPPSLFPPASPCASRSPPVLLFRVLRFAIWGLIAAIMPRCGAVKAWRVGEKSCKGECGSKNVGHFFCLSAEKHYFCGGRSKVRGNSAALSWLRAPVVSRRRAAAGSLASTVVPLRPCAGGFQSPCGFPLQTTAYHFPSHT